MLAALQAPVIMMSQNRQAAKTAWRPRSTTRGDCKASYRLPTCTDKVDRLTQLVAVLGEVEARERVSFDAADALVLREEVPAASE